MTHATITYRTSKMRIPLYICWFSGRSLHGIQEVVGSIPIGSTRKKPCESQLASLTPIIKVGMKILTLLLGWGSSVAKRRSPNRKDPKYRLHKASGNAVVSINGKTHYLGKHGSRESFEKYESLIASRHSKKQFAMSVPKVPLVAHVMAKYLTYIKGHYVKNGEPTSEIHAAKSVLRRLKAYRKTRVSEFGPLAFKAFRKEMIAEGLARTTINHYMFHIRNMFRVSAEDEIIPMQAFWKLRDTRDLQADRSEARETDDIEPVEESVVEATKDQLSATIADMVQLQWLTGMRPGEVCLLRPVDIDTSNDIWLYQPSRHKNQHRKSKKSKMRFVWLGYKAQMILKKYLNRDEMLYCFCPIEASGRGTNVKYTVNAYRNAIQRAAKRAKQDKWHPNQLRHNALTLARERLGLECASQVGGHTTIRTTESVYAEPNQQLAIQFAKICG